MPNSIRPDVWVGAGSAFVIGCLFIFVFFGLGAKEQQPGFRLTAEFGRIDGLAAGSPVRLAGMNIGAVVSVALTDNQRAQVTMLIHDAELPIPSDTAAVIETDGVFGSKYIELHPGGEFDSLSSGQKIEYSQDSVVLESLLNQIVARAQSRQNAESSDGGEH